MTTRNPAASVRARLLNKARAQGVDFQLLLTRYGLERLLYRLSVSRERDNFLLKGALLFDLWYDVPLRPTRDIDLLGFGLAEIPLLLAAFEGICAIEVEEEVGIKANFPPNVQTAETALLFLQYIMRKLRVAGAPIPGGKAAERGGRAAVVVPNGTLFGDGISAVIKEEMLKEFKLHTIVRLPQGVFAPYSDIPANLLFFERGGPTDTIWYYELPLPEGRKKYSKTAPLQLEEFASALAWWNNREEGPQAWKVDFAAKRDAAVAAATPHWQRAESKRNGAIALGKPIRELEQAIQAAANGQKAELQDRLKALKNEQSAHEQAAKSAQSEGDALYWPIYNLDLKNPHAKAGLEHADPKDLIASMRSHEAEVMRLLGEIEARGQQLLQRLSKDLGQRFGRGFSVDNPEQMRLFYLAYPPQRISETPSRNISLEQLAQAMPLSWSHYVRLVRGTRSVEEREFYEAEALRGGWSLRQLDRQISSQFYTRALVSKNKRTMLEKGSHPLPGDALTPDEAIKDPYVLEFLNLKDEYSESELEDALIHRLEDFLLELGRRYLQEDAFLDMTVPIPDLGTQQTLVARLDALAEKTRQVEAHLDAVERDAEHLLALRFRDAIAGAPLRPMAEVAPLVHREVTIDPEKNYTELGVGSFYKGGFHRRTVPGSDFSWQDLYRVHAGDLIFSNIMAWEQAIAIAQAQDDGCVGNHRMLTCEANTELAVPGFLWYYFTTEEGFAKTYAASPGTAAPNRTKTAPALMAIEVPTPPLAAQQTFDRLQTEITALKAKHTAIREANAALLPATLERVFGERRFDLA